MLSASALAHVMATEVWSGFVMGMNGLGAITGIGYTHACQSVRRLNWTCSVPVTETCTAQSIATTHDAHWSHILTYRSIYNKHYHNSHLHNNILWTNHMQHSQHHQHIANHTEMVSYNIFIGSHTVNNLQNWPVLSVILSQHSFSAKLWSRVKLPVSEKHMWNEVQ